MNPLVPALVAGTISASLAGCVAAVVGTAAVTTIDVVHDRRSVGEYFDDGAIELRVRDYVLDDEELRHAAHISATSMNGILLLTGEAPSQHLKDKVEDYAKKVDGVRQVVNEIRIAGTTTMFSRSNDVWLTTKVKTRLFEKTRLDANRVKVVSEHGNVYLMGLVTHAEADAATDVARSVGGVSSVIKVFEYVN